MGDGTVICDSAAGSYVSGTLATGTWYFRAWNYVTVSGGRWYGGYSQASCYNNTVSGSATFTGSTSWTVPTAVRSITVFLVGGGGGSGSSLYPAGCNGGGGGYTTTGTASVTPGQVIYITVGGGGYSMADGGISSLSGAINASASGGHYGFGSSVNNGDAGGSGGSGGGSGHTYGEGGAGGSNGSNGAEGSTLYRHNAPGSGQGSSTACPWDGTLYGGGGGGCGGTNKGGPGYGGSGGGGTGGTIYQTSNAFRGSDGQAGTGGGGGGASHVRGVYNNTSGGSGIVRLKWW